MSDADTEKVRHCHFDKNLILFTFLFFCVVVIPIGVGYIFSNSVEDNINMTEAMNRINETIQSVDDTSSDVEDNEDFLKIDQIIYGENLGSLNTTISHIESKLQFFTLIKIDNVCDYSN